MPQIFRMGEYWIYFWTNENKPVEPIHEHIAKGKPSDNATKVWITSAGKCLLCIIIIQEYLHIRLRIL